MRSRRKKALLAMLLAAMLPMAGISACKNAATNRPIILNNSVFTSTGSPLFMKAARARSPCGIGGSTSPRKPIIATRTAAPYSRATIHTGREISVAQATPMLPPVRSYRWRASKTAAACYSISSAFTVRM